MRLIKNVASNRAELYKLLGNNNTVIRGNLYPYPQINRMDLLEDPASTSIVLYAKDGADYEVYIKSITHIVDFDLN